MAIKSEDVTPLLSNRQCRLCLSNDGVSEINFDETVFGVSIQTKIMACVALVVSPNDMLPKHMCNKCCELINMFFDFRENCMNAYIELCQAISKEHSTSFDEHSYYETSTSITSHTTVAHSTSISESTLTSQIQESQNEREITVKSANLAKDKVKKISSISNKSSDKKNDDETDLNATNDDDDNVENLDDDCIIVIERDFRQEEIHPIDLLEDENSSMKETLEADGYYECDDCSAVFLNIADLTGHVENNKCINTGNKKDYSVSVKKPITIGKTKLSQKSDKLSTSQKELSIFRVGRTLTKEELTCKVCNKQYKTAKGILSHRRSHTGEKFSCSQCKSAFSDPYDLKYHLRIHAANPKYSCKYCKKAFRNPARVTIHERTHTKERPFVCDFCGKSFPTIQNLKLHLRIHTGEKPYPCKFCDRRFRTIPAAVSHQKRHRDGKRMFQCDSCWRMFEKKEDMIKHNNQHKSLAVWRCTHCSLCFKKLSTLKLHIRELHCDEKGKKKSKTAELSDLMAETEEDVVKCNFCDEIVLQQELSEHLAVEHTSEALFMGFS